MRHPCHTAVGQPKLAYLTKSEAKSASRQTPIGLSHGREMRPYRCPECGRFHVGHYKKETA